MADNHAVLDRTDRRLLALLQNDGRAAGVELAEKVGLSPTATGERLKRLAREGFITGYRATLDPVKLGGALVRVRGWIDDRDGPRVAVTHPEQIEVLAVQ